MKNLNKKTISLALIFTLVMAVFMPTIVRADGLHSITVDHGYADVDEAVAGDTVTLSTNLPSNTEFVRWEANTALDDFDANVENTSFTMPDREVELDAIYRHVYGIVTGDFQSFELGTTNDISFVTSASDCTVSTLYLGSDEIDPSYYTVLAEGTTIVLSNSYLNTLSAGFYGLEIDYSATTDGYEGYALASFMVEEGTSNANLTLIDTVNATVTLPAVGTVIVDENTKPTIDLGSNANCSVSWTMFINNYPSVDASYDSGDVFGTTIEAGEDYYVEVYLNAEDGYGFENSSNVALTVNGGTEYELGWCSDTQFSFFTKLTATATTDPTTTDPTTTDPTTDPTTTDPTTTDPTTTDPTTTDPTTTDPTTTDPTTTDPTTTDPTTTDPTTTDPTTTDPNSSEDSNEEEEPAKAYKFVEDGTKTTALDKNEPATFKIDADYSLFEEGGKVFVDKKQVSSDMYTSKAGSTIITLAKEFMSSLEEGEHLLEVVFNNNATATTTFEIAKVDTTEEAEPANNTETTTTETTETPATTTTETTSTLKNPTTGDNIVVWISIMVISIVGIVGTAIYTKKN
ncbi:MAG: hypothetical protein IKP28_03320 [Clostridia bacterium]|nr:hypothetical protein [Clostridia bacterium]